MKLEVGHLCVFSFSVYIHVPKEKRKKLDPSGKKGTFVGYSESSKDYKIYILGSRHIKVSIDVSFEEEVTFKKERGSDMDIDDEDIVAPNEWCHIPLQQFKGNQLRKLSRSIPLI